MLVRVLKLGTECQDKATKLRGTLTHWCIDLGGTLNYLFQPKGLDEEGQPVQKLFLPKERLDVGDEEFEEIDVPMEILGTVVTDNPSGFTGTAIEFIRHINGCFHVVVQPEGLLPKKNTPIGRCDFDLRRCSGKKIPKLSEKARQESIKKEPSPTGDTFNRDPLPTRSLTHDRQSRPG